MSVEENAEEIPSLQVDTACCPHSPSDLNLSKFSSSLLRSPNYYFFSRIYTLTPVNKNSAAVISKPLLLTTVTPIS
jgi:hypothetical protein